MNWADENSSDSDGSDFAPKAESDGSNSNRSDDDNDDSSTDEVGAVLQSPPVEASEKKGEDGADSPTEPNNDLISSDKSDGIVDVQNNGEANLKKKKKNITQTKTTKHRKKRTKTV